MPAPAVIPAPIAYIKIAAVKKLVVELKKISGICLVNRKVRTDTPNFYNTSGSPTPGLNWLGEKRGWNTA